MDRKFVITTSENSTGRNTSFHDNGMTRNQFVKQIESGNLEAFWRSGLDEKDPVACISCAL